MKHIPIVTLLLALVTACQQKDTTKPDINSAIISGIPWYDQNGNTVSAHGACIISENDTYYLFGEYKRDSSINFNGFSCYSSTDLCNWTFEKIVLPEQSSGRLGPNRIGERVKVLKCQKTGEYVMFMHTDNKRYKDPCVGYATSKTINGTYTFQGALLFNGSSIRKWDMGVFQDADSSAYLITHSGNLYSLSDDYKSITKQVVKNMTWQCESPVIFKKDSLYYWIGSGLTSWERNDNYYFTATELAGPWTSRGHIAPEGTLTWNSQSTFVLKIAGTNDTSYMYMGDRWSFPSQNSAATYVWQPLNIDGYSITMPQFKQIWQLNTTTGSASNTNLNGDFIENSDTEKIKYSGSWKHSSDSLTISSSDEENASFSVGFNGQQVGFYGLAQPENGYAKVEISNNNGEIIHTSTIDMYCKYPENSLKFLSPKLPKGKYTLSVSVMREHGTWSDKRKSRYGSTGYSVTLDKVIVLN